MKKDLSVYIHIPFCVKKCNYCDFPSYVCGDDIKRDYVSALLKEIKLSAEYADSFNIKTVFIGGGTPSVLDGKDIYRILYELENTFNGRSSSSYNPDEITIECNPNSVNHDKLLWYKKAGVNRLSIGLQSADEAELKLLGRAHTLDDWENAVSLAREYGFDNINTDIISGIFGQSVESFERTLSKVMEYSPEHISVYSLIIEEGTPFFEKYNEAVMSEAELDKWEETDRKIYEKTLQIMSSNGYRRYEISNYARCGYECKHNIVYWRRGDYLGLGVSAASLINNKRFSNTKDVSEYIYKTNMNLSSVENEELLTKKDEMSEFMFLGLRMSDGISIKEFNENFGVSVYEVYGDVIRKWIDLGMIANKDGRIYCFGDGINICNMIMADFV